MILISLYLLFSFTRRCDILCLGFAKWGFSPKIRKSQLIRGGEGEVGSEYNGVERRVKLKQKNKYSIFFIDALALRLIYMTFQSLWMFACAQPTSILFLRFSAWFHFSILAFSTVFALVPSPIRSFYLRCLVLPLSIAFFCRK